jgi:hypothetical protein
MRGKAAKTRIEAEMAIGAVALRYLALYQSMAS